MRIYEGNLQRRYNSDPEDHDRKITAEERYQSMKEMYYFHDSSSHMRFGDDIPDNYGCRYHACIPECKYYPETGRIEEDVNQTRLLEYSSAYRFRRAWGAATFCYFKIFLYSYMISRETTMEKPMITRIPLTQDQLNLLKRM